ncbi:MAG: hypothetical protein ABI678_31080, partial [Kofleriaceae bacterium]
AELSARLWRRWLLVGCMLALVVVAGVMLYLSVQANRSRGEAERSATAADQAAKLAEDRLTQGLIAQGRRELNDGRAAQALAYFAEAMRRGSDGIALREMIALASRGWKWERRVIRPGTFSALTSSTTHLIAGDQLGTVHWWTLTGEPAGELATGLEAIEQVAPLDGERVLVTGQGGIAIIGEDRKITQRIKVPDVAYMAHLGPAADEITTATHDAFMVFGLDGTLRRKLALEGHETGWQPAFEQHGAYVIVGGQGALTRVDLRTMKRTVLDAGGMTYPAVSADGSTLAYIDKDRDIHFLGSDGVETRKTHGKNDPIGIVFSPTGARFAAFGLRSAIIYDSKTFEMLAQFAIENDQVLFALQGDDFWTGGVDGTVRRYHGSVLVASLPSSGGQVEGLELAGDTLAVVTSDSSLALYDAHAAQFVIDKMPCEHAEPAANSMAMVATCPDGRSLVYVGRRMVGESDEVGMGFVAQDAASGAVALSGAQVRVFDRANQLVASASFPAPRGALGFIDPDHLAVLEAHHGKGLWAWAFRANKWDHVADLAETSALAIVKGGWLVAYTDGRYELRVEGKRVVHAGKLASRADFLAPSADGRWVAAQCNDGGTVIVDGTTGEIARTFAPADSN